MTAAQPTAATTTTAQTTPPQITAIVVVFDPDAENLRQCVESLLASVEVELDVVIVDNASADPETAGAYRQTPGVRVIRQTRNGGFAAAVNAGILATKSQFVWLLNDDAWVEPSCLCTAAATLAAAGSACLGVAPKVLVADDARRVIDSVGNVLLPTGAGFNLGIGQPDIGQFETPERCFGVCFAAGLFRRSAFEHDSVGLLDERYFLYYEDIDWSLRANRLGYFFQSAPAAVAHHRHAASTRRLGLANRYRLVERNLLINATKNLEPLSMIKIWLRRFYVHTVDGIRGPYRLARWQAIGSALTRVPQLLVTRVRQRRTSSISDAELFAFSNGEQPFFDADTFEATSFAAATAAAEARLLRHGHNGHP